DPDAALDVQGDILEDAPADVSEEEILEDADEEDVESEGELPVEPTADRVLFIGNSYTAVNTLHVIVSDLLVEAGHEGYTLDVTPGGYRLDQHADDADGSSGDTRLRDLLVTGEEAALGWDVVVLQQQSQVAGFPRTEPTWIAMQEGATTLRDLAMDAGADTVIFMTWGYRDGDGMNPTLYPDYPTMQDRLSDGYTDLASRLSTGGEPVFIAPAGESYRSISLEGDTTLFEGLYATDGSHPSIRGSYLAACTIFATITGTSPVGMTSGPTEIDATERLSIQETAAAVVFATDAPENWTR
ncbi:MAG: DUF4886 domain-containing protein, partial [Deltaproteobacteria bacterium]|nr:DUF4886 domain-containing protein [Deltaproteobacteria bacterium]